MGSDHTEHCHLSMDRAIFNLKLSVPATSAYILIASLASENVPADLETIRTKWNSSTEDLEQALADLMAHGVLRTMTRPDGQTLFCPNPSSLWHQ